MGRKMPNGHGGVTLHRGSGRWRARLTVDGHELTRYAATQGEAWKLLEAMRRQAAAGLSMRADQVKLADYLTAWLDDVAALRLKPSTMAAYRSHVQGHLAPAFGRVTLDKLTPGHIQRMIKDKTDAGLTPLTIRHIRSTLRKALNDAVRQGMIAVNPARLVTLPAVKTDPVAAMEPERAAAILEAVKGHRLAALMTVAMLTGMRKGELLGLPWKAVDLVAGQLTVTQSLSRHNGAWVLAEPKTKRSRRTLHLSPLAVAALREHEDRQRFEQKTAGDAWQNSAGLVFVAQDGRPLHNSTAWRALADCLAAAGLPPMRFHDQRHAYATLSTQAGASLREVQEGLGHASITTTANVYAHVTPATMRTRSDDLEALITKAGRGAAQGGG